MDRLHRAVCEYKATFGVLKKSSDEIANQLHAMSLRMQQIPSLEREMIERYKKNTGPNALAEIKEHLKDKNRKYLNDFNEYVTAHKKYISVGLTAEQVSALAGVVGTELQKPKAAQTPQAQTTSPNSVGDLP